MSVHEILREKSLILSIPSHDTVYYCIIKIHTIIIFIIIIAVSFRIDGNECAHCHLKGRVELKKNNLIRYERYVLVELFDSGNSAGSVMAIEATTTSTVSRTTELQSEVHCCIAHRTFTCGHIESPTFKSRDYFSDW